ncbi:MAG: translation initiation factor IF-3 [Candidatus Parcubacteria bacterium]|nr:translation initiation factor IF-3 [Candidatus Parcubacteria bacterium]
MDERINTQIRAPQLRVIGPDGSPLGVISRDEALTRAEQAGMDLVEISPNAVPPVAKILDYGKFVYEKNKKEKATKTKAHVIELKSLQVTIGTGEHDLELKAKNASTWLKEGHRVKINLFLKGRAKYLNESFLKERLDRLLHFITEEYKIVDGPKKGPKGLTLIVERSVKK